MISEIKFSIIIPMFNSQKFIKKTLKSVINQTYKNFEVVIINDGSKDSSLSICKEFQNNDDRIIIYNKNNEGLAKARFDGVNLANSDYIVFLDADDWVELTMLEVYYKNIIVCGADILQSNFYSKFRFMKKLHKKSICEFNGQTLKEKYLVDILGTAEDYLPLYSFAWGKAYKTCLLKRNLHFHKRFIPFAEDVYFNLIVYSDENLGKIKILDDILWYYRQGTGMSAKQSYNNWIMNYLIKNDAITEFLKDNNLYEDNIVYKSYIEIVYIAINSLIYEFDNNRNEEIIFKKIISFFSNKMWINAQCYFKNLNIELDKETRIFTYSTPKQYMEHVKQLQSEITFFSRIKRKVKKFIKFVV